MVTGPFRHDADGSLFLAGGSSQEALVLIRVSVGAAHRDVLLMAVELTDTLDLGSVFSTGSSETARPSVTHS